MILNKDLTFQVTNIESMNYISLEKQTSIVFTLAFYHFRLKSIVNSFQNK